MAKVPVKGAPQATYEINRVQTDVVIGQKVVATAGTELPLTATSTPLKFGVYVTAKSGNTGLIGLGKNPVTMATGHILAQGETLFIPIDNANKIYVDAATSGDGVNILGW